MLDWLMLLSNLALWVAVLQLYRTRARASVEADLEFDKLMFDRLDTMPLPGATGNEKPLMVSLSNHEPEVANARLVLRQAQDERRFSSLIHNLAQSGASAAEIARSTRRGREEVELMLEFRS